jgi:hypothetical protein
MGYLFNEDVNQQYINKMQEQIIDMKEESAFSGGDGVFDGPGKCGERMIITIIETRKDPGNGIKVEMLNVLIIKDVHRIVPIDETILQGGEIQDRGEQQNSPDDQGVGQFIPGERLLIFPAGPGF